MERGDYGSALASQLAAVGIASDAAGNLFFATSGNYLDYLAVPSGGRVRELTGGNMFGVAGTGQVGADGDGGLAVNAQLNDPMGVAVDGAGNFYIADTYNYRIRKVSVQNKNITTIAGSGAPGYSGDGGAATSAQIGRPFRIAVDASGNIYIADFDNNVIRKVDAATGIIKTIAGTGTAGYSGDNGPATSATMDRPSALALNAAGDLFFFDFGKNVLRKVSAATGIITTVAGSGIRGYGGDNGPALSALLGRSYGIAVDASGTIYMADVDNGVIRMLTTGTTACTYAVSPLAPQVDIAGGNVTLTITTGASCAWSLPALPNWITAAGATSGTGTANVTLVVAANTGAARNASLTVAGSTVTISQAAGVCTYSISPEGQFFAAAGGNGTFQLVAASGCSWTVSSAQPWVTLTGATGGNGTGTIAYQVAANAGAERQGTITYLPGGDVRSGDFSSAPTPYTINQSSGSVAGLAGAGSLAHFAAAGGWTTTFTLVNTGASTATAQLDFTGDNGSPIVLPLSLPQTNQTGLSGSTIQQTLPAGGVLPIVSAGLTSQPEVTGVAELLTTGKVGGYSVFTYQSAPDTQWFTASRQEAVVPLETRNAPSYVLAFDNTNGVLYRGRRIEHVGPGCEYPGCHPQRLGRGGEVGYAHAAGGRPRRVPSDHQLSADSEPNRHSSVHNRHGRANQCARNSSKSAALVHFHSGAGGGRVQR